MLSMLERREEEDNHVGERRDTTDRCDAVV